MITVKLGDFDQTYRKICEDKKKCVMLFTSEED